MSGYKALAYIGSKSKLLTFLEENITTYLGKNLCDIDSFADLFSGSGIVSYYLIKKNCNVILTNDTQHYAYIISSVLTKKNINIQKIDKIIDILNNINCDNPNNVDFIYSNYTPNNDCDRMYFTTDNGIKIDRIRQHIEKYKIELNDNEYRLLIKILLYAVTSIANTSVVFGAYLKHFKKSALKPLILDKELLFKLSENEAVHSCYNKDVITLLNDINLNDIEVCYIDSPYTARDYNTNYGLLETISKYDNPKIHGKTGLRDDTSTKSKFCSKVNAEGEFEKILSKIKSKYVFISYSSESIVPKNKLLEILEQYWTNIICYEKDYKRFKSNNNCEQSKTVKEYLFAATLKL
jgi:adenine-specific DNA-methyltransferase